MKTEARTPLLSIRDLHAGYGAIKALHGISLDVHEGEIVSLIGSNGAGKSTLLMSLFGNPQPSAGEIVFDGVAINNFKTHEVAKRGIALSPEGRRVFPAMSVMENLKMGAILRPTTEIQADLERVFHLFPRLHERQTQRAGTLSGGEQQMLAIGRAIMARPKLLLLDEPSLGLAPLIVKQIFETIKEVASQKTTIFLVEQNASQALKLADRAYVLVNGQITLSGTGSELLANPEIKNAYLGH